MRRPNSTRHTRAWRRERAIARAEANWARGYYLTPSGTLGMPSHPSLFWRIAEGEVIGFHRVQTPAGERVVYHYADEDSSPPEER
jgi:hypothetical protein